MLRTTRSAQAAALVGLVAAVMSLSACQPVALQAGSASTAASGADATDPAAASYPASGGSGSSLSGGSGSGGAGSLTLSITSPRAVSGHVDTTVTCATGRRYRASTDADVRGYAVRVNASAIGYTGPGSYPTTLSGTITSPDGEAFALAAVRTTGQLDADGGSTSFSVSGSRGHTLAGSLAWRCS